MLAATAELAGGQLTVNLYNYFRLTIPVDASDSVIQATYGYRLCTERYTLEESVGLSLYEQSLAYLS